MSFKSLPARPNLDHLKDQARKLLAAHQSHDASACPTLRLLHRFTSVSDSAILAALVSLQEAQFALALDYGFKGWNELKDHVEGTREVSAMTNDALNAMTDEQVAEMTGYEMGRGDEVGFARALAAMNPGLRERFLAPLSERGAEAVRREMKALPVLGEADRRAVLADFAWLARAWDLIPGRDLTPGKLPVVQESARAALDRELAGAPASRRAVAALVPLLQALARVARSEGIAALDQVVSAGVDDESLKLGVRLLAEGKFPEVARDILSARVAATASAEERRVLMIAAVVDAIGRGYNPSRIEEKCRPFLQYGS